MRAAVLWEPRRPVEILDVDLAPPRAREVLVKIAASGICASDLHVVDGALPEPMPLVLGHEASGVVVAAGPEVTRVREGDHVVLAIVPSCGDCPACSRGRPTFCELFGAAASTGTLADGTSRLTRGGTTLHHFNSVSAFAEYAVVPESAAVAIRRDVPLETAALIGCAVLTGYGAVTNIARVGAGESVAVWGCGGVGLIAVQAARLAGADPIVAVEVNPQKLELARELGATVLVHALEVDAVEAVRAAAGGAGVDYAFEALGREQTIQQAWSSLAPGGTAVVVGMMPKGHLLTIDPWGFISEKNLVGCFLGCPRIEEDVPRLVDLYRAGELKLDEVVSHRLRLDEIGRGLERLRAGTAARQVIVFD
jgi:S-(hydroxymethyl)glutathione dehydrogenase / alcohol dehydrogenase